MRLGLVRCAALAVVWGMLASPLLADTRQPRMGIFTKPGATVDLTLPLVDEEGRAMPLRDFIRSGKPFILVPIFYKCPRLCGLTFGGVIELVNNLPEKLGEDYVVVSYSFNPKEGPKDAQEKRSEVFQRLKVKPVPTTGWRFLTASSESINALNESIGFRVRMADTQFEHSSAIFIVSPSGVVQKYFAGVEFNPKLVSAAFS